RSSSGRAGKPQGRNTARPVDRRERDPAWPGRRRARAGANVFAPARVVYTPVPIAERHPWTRRALAGTPCDRTIPDHTDVPAPARAHHPARALRPRAPSPILHAIPQKFNTSRRSMTIDPYDIAV